MPPKIKTPAPPSYDHTIAMMAAELYATDAYDTIPDAVETARAIVGEVIRTADHPIPPAVVTENLQAAIDGAAAGAVLWVDPNLVEPGPIAIRQPLTLMGNPDARLGRSRTGGLAPIEGQLPRILGGLTITGSDVVVSGFEIQKTQDYYDIVVLEDGDTMTLRGCRILGDPVRGNKRAVRANAPNILIADCYMDHCFAPGQDSQCVIGYDNSINLTIERCLMYAASENVLLGGADCASEDRQPRNFTMTHSECGKREEWKGKGYNVKNLFELKNVIGATVTDNYFHDNWSDAQVGYAIVFTPRNQGNTNPYANVTDVVFARNRIAHVCAFCNLLGTDYPNPSGIMSNIVIEDNEIDDLDRVKYGNGSDKTINCGDGVNGLTIARNRYTNALNVGSVIYFYGKPNDNVNVVDNQFPETWKWGIIMGADSAPGQASWDKFVLHGNYSGNTPA